MFLFYFFNFGRKTEKNQLFFFFDLFFWSETFPNENGFLIEFYRLFCRNEEGGGWCQGSVVNEWQGEREREEGMKGSERGEREKRKEIREREKEIKEKKKSIYSLKGQLVP